MMKKYISILRGINVSGKNKIKMAELKAMYEGLGFENVVTYIQSGNILFDYKKEKKEVLCQKIRNGIEATFDYDVPVLIIEFNTLQKTFENNPFQKNNDPDIKPLYITFLENVPEKELVEKLENPSGNEDDFVIQGDVIYVYCPGGYGRTKLTNNFFERKLKQTATTRNWKTVTKLIELAE